MKAPGELWIVARCLGDVLDEVVFVGGMIRELLITDPAAGPARPTQDVDCIVDTVSWMDYVRLSERLRARGFAECRDEGAPICRWVVQKVRVDVMPIDPAVLGFSNVWYPSAVEHATRVEGPDGPIRIVNAVHFCATKIEAFLERGEGDFFHHDMEDLIAVVDARAELVTEIGQAPTDVRDFIAEQIGDWLSNEKFVDALAGNLAGDPASQARQPILLARLRQIAALARAETGVATAVSPQAPAPALKASASAWGGPGLGAPAAIRGQVLFRSSNLRAAEYDLSAHVLTIDFRSGTAYAYGAVPQNVYDGLVRAASHGKYFNQWIKNRYRYRRLR